MKVIRHLLLLSVSLSTIFISPLQAKKHACVPDESFDIALNFPPDFGKTHFIVGYPLDEIQHETRVKPQEDSLCAESFGLICNGKIKQAFFAPDDNIQKVLLFLIKQEKKSIKLTAFSFTDADIAQALIDAEARGVDIELIVDPGFAQDKFTKITMLQENGLDIFIYDPDYKKKKKKSFYSSIMHNKFIIFEKNVLEKSIIWTGSFNFTKSAYTKNHENVIVLDDEQVVQKYQQHFDVLKTRAHASKKKRVRESKNPTLSKKGTVFEDGVATA